MLTRSDVYDFFGTLFDKASTLHIYKKGKFPFFFCFLDVEGVFCNAEMSDLSWLEQKLLNAFPKNACYSGTDHFAEEEFLILLWIIMKGGKKRCKSEAVLCDC